MSRRRQHLLTLIAFTAPFCSAHADRIVLGGRAYDPVLVVESHRAYYVCFPSDGHTLSLAKTDPQIEELVIDPDTERRDALHTEFKARKSQRKKVAHPLAVNPRPSAVDLHSEYANSPSDSPSGKPASRNTGVPEIRLKGEPRAAPPELQAIIDANLAAGGSGQSGNAAGGAAGANAGAARGGGSRGGSGGGGSRRGGSAGAGGGAGGFTNISETFSTINDTDVGEPPSPFGN